MTPEIETEIPDGESPARCPHCSQPFTSETLRTLHEGVAHYDALDDDCQEAFAEAYENEHESIRLFRLKALIVLVALYFGFLWTYSLVG